MNFIYGCLDDFRDSRSAPEIIRLKDQDRWLPLGPRQAPPEDFRNHRTDDGRPLWPDHTDAAGSLARPLEGPSPPERGLKSRCWEALEAKAPKSEGHPLQVFPPRGYSTCFRTDHSASEANRTFFWIPQNSLALEVAETLRGHRSAGIEMQARPVRSFGLRHTLKWDSGPRRWAFSSTPMHTWS